MPGTPELLVIAFAVFVPGIPGYTIGKRSGLRWSALAFIPVIGLWIVLLRLFKTGWWLALLIPAIVLLPFLGGPAVSIWTGLEVPIRHGRSGRWSIVLIVPLVNLLAYWPYAFTLPKQGTPDSGPVSQPDGAVAQPQPGA